MLRPVVVLAVLPLVAPLAVAQNPLIGPRTLSLFPLGEERCFRATFSDAEMKAHKGQILRTFQLFRLLRPNPLKESIDASRDEAVAADRKLETENWTDVVVRLDGKKGFYSQTVVCNDDQAGAGLHCYVECDGGSFGVTPGSASLGIAFDEGNGLALNSSCGEGDEEGGDFFLTDVQAGHSFTLRQEAPEACAVTDQEARPSYAADPVPLRTRIAEAGWTCLSRVYDKAHLAGHPQQKVAAIALALKSAPAASVDADGWRSTDFSATLSLRLRDGKSAAQDVTCTADDYQYRCDGAFRVRRKDGASAMLVAGEYGGEGAETPEQLIGLKLGSDDLVFRLDGSKDQACTAK